VFVSSRGWLREAPIVGWQHAASLRELGAVPLAWAEGVPADSVPAEGVLREPPAMAGVLPSVDVIIQATSAGMRGAGPGESVSDWIPWQRLARGAVAIDVVYNPPLTPFLAAAERHGVVSKGGLGMLVRQAAAAIAIWLGSEPGFRLPDLAELHAAAERALRARGHA
jgi:shikimate 5-dehydrogenase